LRAWVLRRLIGLSVTETGLALTGPAVATVVMVEAERIAAMTYFEFDAPLMRFQHILESMGISQALEEAGIQAEDTVHIGEEELSWGDQE